MTSYLSRLAMVWVAALFAAGSVGCQSLQPPSAAVRSATLGDVTADGLVLNLALDVTNPNDVALPIGNTDYALALGGVKVLSGKLDPDATVGAGATQSVTLPINVSYESLLNARSAIVRSRGNVPFEFTGRLNFGSAAGIPLIGDRSSIPLNYSGTLPLRDALDDPMTLLRSQAARDLAQALLGR